MCGLILLLLLGICHGFLLDGLFNRQVCYGDLGCFDTQTIRSLARPIVLLPDDPVKIATRFFLYSRQNPTMAVEQEISRKDRDTLKKSAFNASRLTKFIVHGFTHSSHEAWVQDMIRELLVQGDYNIITVDWRNGAGFPYTQATANIRVVAAELTKLIEFIRAENPSISAKDLHIIGHSLGAHCGGEVGTKVKGLGRISGLDPAEPYFEGAVESVRLEPRDAEFVDIIHSDGSAFLGSLGMGYRSSIGHVDFYPNGGGDQPGCQTGAGSKVASSVVSGVSAGWSGMKDTFACSHLKAVYYYIESINSKCPFTAYPCTTYDDFASGKCLSCEGSKCSVMGFHADKSPARGDFYLLTSQQGASPYCNYHYSLSVKAGLLDKSAYGKISVTLTGGNGAALGPIDLTDKPVMLAANAVQKRLVTSSLDIGPVATAKVAYTKDDCLTCFLYTDFFRLASLEVTRGEADSTALFCGANLSIAKQQFRQFTAEPSTTSIC